MFVLLFFQGKSHRVGFEKNNNTCNKKLDDDNPYPDSEVILPTPRTSELKSLRISLRREQNSDTWEIYGFKRKLNELNDLDAEMEKTEDETNQQSNARERKNLSSPSVKVSTLMFKPGILPLSPKPSTSSFEEWQNNNSCEVISDRDDVTPRISNVLLKSSCCITGCECNETETIEVGEALNIENLIVCSQHRTCFKNVQDIEQVSSSSVNQHDYAKYLQKEVVYDTVDSSSCHISDESILPSSSQSAPEFFEMFVRYIPRWMNKVDLKKLFEEFGKVHDVQVQKGCCLVTFYTKRAALKAKYTLHNIKTLKGMHRPVQMEPATQKVYVGNLKTGYNENDVRNLFSKYGTILECKILHNARGFSKDCGFVTFDTQQAAISAIKGLHKSKPKGFITPLVVELPNAKRWRH